MNRILAIVRMQLRLWVLLVIPWVIITVTLGANALILWILHTQGVETPNPQYNGVVLSLFFFVASLYGASMTQIFPFALGLGVTRRDYFLGTLVFAVGQGVATAAIWTAMAAIERATDGFGVRLQSFTNIDQITGNHWLGFAGITVVVVACAAVGALIGVVFLRWKATGMFGAVLVTAVAASIAAVLITWQRGWPAVGRFFTETPVGWLLVAVPLVLMAAFFAGGYALLRRAEV